MKYSRYTGTRATPQRERVFGREDQVPNSEGGFVFGLDKWARAERFLVLGSKDGSYYATERKLTVDNAKSLVDCLKEDGLRLVALIDKFSQEGRAPKQGPILFALALCASLGDTITRRMAFAASQGICRTASQHMQFQAELDGLRGWGKARQKAVRVWYNGQAVSDLAYQMVKYRKRSGYTHRDLLLLGRVKPVDEAHNVLYRWTVGKLKVLNEEADLIWESEDLDIVRGYELAKMSSSVTSVVHAITTYRLPREAIDNKWLKHPEVWEALLYAGRGGMPMTAMIRNLNKMTNVGLLAPFSKHSQFVAERLVSEEYWGRDWTASRTKPPHPFQILMALTTYAEGCSPPRDVDRFGRPKYRREPMRWSPVPGIIDALDRAFYLSFKTVEPTNKRLMLALDVSGSMSGKIVGSHLSAAQGEAAMAMVTLAVEPKIMTVAFSGSGPGKVELGDARRYGYGGLYRAICEFPMSKRMRLDDVVHKIQGYVYGATDCSLPMLYALRKGYEVDAFVVYTDHETWSGVIHPYQALQQYRRETGIPAKLVCVGMVPNEFSIADPNDGGMLDVVGFDSAAPAVISNFIRGEG
jgi:60 kDa SS-A/Ro ribonucleoprotein